MSTSFRSSFIEFPLEIAAAPIRKFGSVSGSSLDSLHFLLNFSYLVVYIVN